MSTNDEREQALMNSVREERQVARESTVALPSTEGLYRGHPLYRRDLNLDVVLWVSSAALPPLRRVKRASSLVEFLERFADEVNAGNAMTCAFSAQLLLKGGLRPPAEIYVGDALARTALYAWLLGHPDAAALVIEHASRLALSASSSRLRSVRYWQTCMAAVLSMTGPDPMGPRDHGHDLRRAVGRLIEVGANSVSVLKADKAAEAEERAGSLSPFESRLAQINKLVDDAEVEPAGLDDADSFLVEPALPRPAAVTGPSLVVIQDLDHLPDSRLDKGAPRAEFGPIAGVALPLVKVPDLAEASAVLKGEFPWAAHVVDRLLGGLTGRESVRMAPQLFTGRSGGGKTALARRVAEVLGLHTTVVPCGGVHDGAFGGTSRQWSSGRAAVAAQSLNRSRTGNPCLILDELEKASTDRRNGSIHDALLAMVGDHREAFHDPFLETAVNLSHVVWIGTCNSTHSLRGPLLDRFVVHDIPDPSARDIEVIVAGILRQVREQSGVDPRFVPDLDPVEWDVLKRGWRGGSIRPLKRAVDRLLSLRSAPGLAH
jgi:hypothetical protein